ncbi:acetyltransferase [Actinomycetospora sp. TBRC 11914]|uniref:acetyltransferase n=1 Tax=Actinomycetospora sp. TBRC 11914 TaxID=2729387 RepID=UPI00145F9CDC|nr:acetyltransferase [Actinomycetospora sp. TBRC 11914]NMO93758.1 acetyltransferase [Actinomycetospora sp. TBRC 11914]
MDWSIRDVAPQEREALVGLWRRAVEATHHFLGAAQVDELEPQTRAELARAAIRVAVGPDGALAGFLAGTGGAVDGLFVDPAVHGRGVGTALLDDAAARHAVLTLDVNEQNPAARDWYARRGFVQTGRSETDDDGRPYPLLHLRRVTPPRPGPDRALQNDRRRDPREGTRDPE